MNAAIVAENTRLRDTLHKLDTEVQALKHTLEVAREVSAYRRKTLSERLAALHAENETIRQRCVIAEATITLSNSPMCSLQTTPDLTDAPMHPVTLGCE